MNGHLESSPSKAPALPNFQALPNQLGTDNSKIKAIILAQGKTLHSFRSELGNIETLKH